MVKLEPPGVGLSFAVVLDPRDQLLSQFALDPFGRLELDIPEDGSLVLFSIPLEDLVAPDGLSIDARRVSIASASSPAPPKSCGRCLASLSGPPALVSPGDRCRVPWFAPAIVHRSSGSFIHEEDSPAASAPLVERARSSVLLDWQGECNWPKEELPTTSPEPLVCPFLPEEGPWTFDPVAISADGTVVGVAPGRYFVKRPGVPAAEGEFPNAPFTAVETLPGRKAIAALNETPSLTRFITIDLESLQTSDVHIDLQTAGLLLRLASGDLLVAGRQGESLSARTCRRIDGRLDCVAERFPSPTGDCAWMLDTGTLVRAAESDGLLIVGPSRGAGLLLRSRGAWSCNPSESRTKGGAPFELLDVGCYSVHGDRAIVGARARIGPEELDQVVLRARIVNDPAPRLTDWEEVARVDGAAHGGCASRQWIERLGRFRIVFESSLTLDLDANGELLSRFEPLQSHPWSGITQPVSRVVTSSAGWILARGKGGELFVSAPTSAPATDRFEQIYGPADGPKAAISGAVRLSDGAGCAIFAETPGFVKATLDPSSTGCESIRSEHRTIDGAPSDFISMVARREDGRALLGLQSGRYLVVDLTDESVLEEVDLAEIEGGLVGAAWLTTNSFLLATRTKIFEASVGEKSYRPVEIVSDDPLTQLVEAAPVDMSLFSIDSAGGVVWVAGSSSILRVTPGGAGAPARAEYFWSSRLPPLDDGGQLIETRVESLRALAPDRVLLVTRDTYGTVAERQRLYRVTELLASEDTDRRARPVSTFAMGSLDVTSPILGTVGVGVDMTVVQKQTLLRPGTKAAFMPFQGLSVGDCGRFVVVGGNAGHAAAVMGRLDP